MGTKNDDHASKLTTKQRRFIDLYLGECRFNASAAALAAGFHKRESGAENLSSARIDAELSHIAASRAEILAELRDVAFRPLDEFIEVKTYGNQVVARMDARAKMHAPEMLARAHWLFTENVNISGSLRREIVLVRHPRGDNLLE